MAEGFLSRHSPLRIDIQHPFEKVQSLKWNLVVYFLVEVEITSFVLSKDILGIGAWEEPTVRQDFMEDSTQRENVACCSCDSLALFVPSNFRSNISRGPTSLSQARTVRMNGQTKINDDWLTGVSTCEHDVFRLNVPVDNTVIVYLYQSL